MAVNRLGHFPAFYISFRRFVLCNLRPWYFLLPCSCTEFSWTHMILSYNLEFLHLRDADFLSSTFSMLLLLRYSVPFSFIIFFCSHPFTLIFGFDCRILPIPQGILCGYCYFIQLTLPSMKENKSWFSAYSAFVSAKVTPISHYISKITIVNPYIFKHDYTSHYVA